MSTKITQATTEVSSMGHSQRTIANTANGTRVVAAATSAKFGVRLKAAAGNTEPVFVGGFGVTTSTGYPLAAGEELPIPVGNATDVYAICASGGQTLAAIWF